jgi:hypothetical protein
MPEAEQRCARTELLESQCGCPDHRGQLPEPLQTGGTSLSRRLRLDAGDHDGPVFEAGFRSGCPSCGLDIEPGDQARYSAVEKDYVHAVCPV